jgi:hypothetical protein
LKVDGLALLPQTERYLDTLINICASGPLSALGAIGVGNELLLVEEYGAANRAYAMAFDGHAGSVFFAANIDADDTHSRLCAEIASGFCDLYGVSASEYDYAAERAIMARQHFYNQLVRAHRNGKLPL